MSRQFLSQRKTLNTKSKFPIKTILKVFFGLNDENYVCDNKKLFSFLKSCKQDQPSVPPIQQGSKLVTNATMKAGVYNQQFLSVFTTKELLSLSRLCTVKRK